MKPKDFKEILDSIARGCDKVRISVALPSKNLYIDNVRCTQLCKHSSSSVDTTDEGLY